MTEKKAEKVELKEDGTLSVELMLPKELAEEILEIQKEDPELLARMFQYALTRRTVYQHMRSEDERREHPVHRETGRLGSLSSHQQRVVDENPDR